MLPQLSPWRKLGVELQREFFFKYIFIIVSLKIIIINIVYLLIIFNKLRKKWMKKKYVIEKTGFLKCQWKMRK